MRVVLKLGEAGIRVDNFLRAFLRVTWEFHVNKKGGAVVIRCSSVVRNQIQV